MAKKSSGIYGSPVDRPMDSNPYGFMSNDEAERISSAALNGESLQKTDDLFKVGGPRFGLEDHVIDINTGKTGSAKGGHGHQGDVEGGSAEVRNPRADHERATHRDKPAVHERESLEKDSE
jgi:hypothetical protein